MALLRTADGKILTLGGKLWLLGSSAMSGGGGSTGGDDTGVATGIPGMGGGGATYATTFSVAAAANMTVGTAAPVTVTPGTGVGMGNPLPRRAPLQVCSRHHPPSVVARRRCRSRSPQVRLVRARSTPL